jgi:hypothetical protein
MRAIAIVILSGSLAACATQPNAPAAGTGLNSKVSPQGSVVATPPVGTTGAPGDHPIDNANVVNQGYLKLGYKAVHVNGQLRYCRSEILTGTHLANTICLTDAQLKAAEQDRQAVVDQLGKAKSVQCTPPSTCN